MEATFSICGKWRINRWKVCAKRTSACEKAMYSKWAEGMWRRKVYSALTYAGLGEAIFSRQLKQYIAARGYADSCIGANDVLRNTVTIKMYIAFSVSETTLILQRF